MPHAAPGDGSFATARTSGGSVTGLVSVIGKPRTPEANDQHPTAADEPAGKPDPAGKLDPATPRSRS